MKTLDEVIHGIECQNCTNCAYYDDSDPYPCQYEECQKDALHYLKAYKDDRNDLSALRAFWKEQHENPPLTWDELKQMEGKPVWVEERYCHYWAVIGKYESTTNHEYLCLRGLFLMDKDDLGKTWQAYRKERSS